MELINFTQFGMRALRLPLGPEVKSKDIDIDCLPLSRAPNNVQTD